MATGGLGQQQQSPSGPGGSSGRVRGRRLHLLQPAAPAAPFVWPSAARVLTPLQAEVLQRAASVRLRKRLAAARRRRRQRRALLSAVGGGGSRAAAAFHRHPARAPRLLPLQGGGHTLAQPAVGLPFDWHLPPLVAGGLAPPSPPLQYPPPYPSPSVWLPTRLPAAREAGGSAASAGWEAHGRGGGGSDEGHGWGHGGSGSGGGGGAGVPYRRPEGEAAVEAADAEAVELSDPGTPPPRGAPAAAPNDRATAAAARSPAAAP
ncbi:hypothetical protein TSOC_010313 [Tetrabaena socialis]|uniref:Uncharacterized protein n=1 Tax=Tetrabaena socialis TaxID=47790 RepID=A0A2J7ZTL1_9CHLO|nr:hypothetical protein TSOC_010313 [Tetrabaena socialis]|eukprot:PNH03611.1 hypothetical protein TSOC_010313 [Tetrabaena socialis]